MRGKFVGIIIGIILALSFVSASNLNITLVDVVMASDGELSCIFKVDGTTVVVDEGESVKVKGVKIYVIDARAVRSEKGMDECKVAISPLEWNRVTGDITVFKKAETHVSNETNETEEENETEPVIIEEPVVEKETKKKQEEPKGFFGKIFEWLRNLFK